jgi:Pyruvate/2-oxoacid:ferredoxin oxidoreductase gamma subunit
MLGATVAILGTDLGLAEEELREHLGHRLSSQVVEKNVAALRAGYAAVKGAHVGA